MARCVKGLYKMNNDSAFYYFHCELYDQYAFELLDEWQQNKGNEDARQAWRLIPDKLLINTFKYNQKTGLTRDKQIDKIQEIIIENAIKLDINTVLFGHLPTGPNPAGAPAILDRPGCCRGLNVMLRCYGVMLRTFAVPQLWLRYLVRPIF